MTYRYLHLDVFTTRRFEGNQLAVFPDARGLSAAAMQTIAREMSFSESTFILPAEAAGTDVRMRIFTPATELPMAGHPTIGSTFALAHLGIIRPGRDRFVFGLGVGPTDVGLTWQDGALRFAWMDQRLPEYRPAANTPAAIAAAIGVSEDTVRATGLPIEEISCGVPFLVVSLPTRAAIDAAVPDMRALQTLHSAFGSPRFGVLIFTAEPTAPDVHAYSRMFGPGLGVAEDPATGSASGPLGCYLVKHALAPVDAHDDMVSWQGVAMGRPSRIHIAIGRDTQGAVSRVRVGGQAVLVAEGTLST